MSDAEGEEQHPSSADNPVLVEDLLKRCRDLLRELEEFKTFLVEQKKENAVELRQFYNSVASELKSLEKVCELLGKALMPSTDMSIQLSTADPTADLTVHTLRSSNLPFYTAVWTAAKSCTGLVTFNKRFYWDAQPTRDVKRGAKPKRRSALVDIVAQDGAEWVKVSTITETRLLFELAKAGWECGDSTDDSEDEHENGDLAHTPRAGKGKDNDKDDSDDGKVELIKLAEDLKKAASCTRVRYRHPAIRFVLPKLHTSSVPEIASILAAIRATGATVQCASDLPAPTSPAPNGTNALLPTFFRLLPHPFTHFTPTLNIDCTILLALVSDLSHHPITPEPWFHKAITRQIALEAREHLLPGSLYPALRGRDLVCTTEAARRMREIVACIGTEAEKARTRVVLGDTDDDDGRMNGEKGALNRELGRWSEHVVPGDLRLPIREVAGAGEGEGKVELSRVQRKVAGRLTVINRSVFLYGWREGVTTVSSNRTVAKLIEGIVEEEMKGEEAGERGPDVWLCGTARSLVGKEKGRGGGGGGMGEEYPGVDDDDGIDVGEQK